MSDNLHSGFALFATENFFKTAGNNFWEDEIRVHGGVPLMQTVLALQSVLKGRTPGPDGDAVLSALLLLLVIRA